MKGADMIEQVFSIPKAAQECGLSRGTIWNYVNSGDLKAFRTPGGQFRILRGDLVAFMARKQMPPLLSDTVRRGRILVVDDDVAAARMIGRLLEPYGFDIETANDGFDAGVKVASFKPGLLILDLYMPGMDGFEVCRHIKADPSTAAMKVLAISGEATPEVEERILAEGADVLMGKPLDSRELVRQVVRLLQTEGLSL